MKQTKFNSNSGSYDALARALLKKFAVKQVALRDSLGLWLVFPKKVVQLNVTGWKPLGKMMATRDAIKAPSVAQLNYLEMAILRLENLHLQEKLERRDALIQANLNHERGLRRKDSQRLTKQFAEKIEAFGHFSHDLKTPFSMLISSAEALAVHGDKIPAKLRVRLESIRMGIHKVLRAAGNSIDAAQLFSRRTRVNRVHANLSSFVHDVVFMYSLVFESYGIRLETKITPGVFSQFDPLQVEKILNNLLSNAIKHNIPGGRTLVTVARSKGKSIITISDNGLGFASTKGAMRRIRDDNPAVFSSHGYGLKIVKQYVRQNGGTIQILDSPKGVSVNIRLPLSRQSSGFERHTMQHTHREIEFLAAERTKLSRRRGVRA